MSKIFLRAEWKNLLMANYLVDPKILKNHLPCHTEIDMFNGNCYVSLVGFLFKNTRIKGVSLPFHKTFEEVNLRFYVRYKESSSWKTGVVFLKEIVPKRMICFVANLFYNEHYIKLRMKHIWETEDENLKTEYYWKVSGEWNYMKSLSEMKPSVLIPGSEEEFITEHYWGYTIINPSCTGNYQVIHPKWNIHKVIDFDINCSAGELYGDEFNDLLKDPASVFHADGSEVQIMGRNRITGDMMH